MPYTPWTVPRPPPARSLTEICSTRLVGSKCNQLTTHSFVSQSGRRASNAGNVAISRHSGSLSQANAPGARGERPHDDIIVFGRECRPGWLVRCLSAADS